MKKHSAAVQTASTGTVRSTPQDFFDWVDWEVGGFRLDVCASPDNAKCTRFYSELDNGLAQPWVDPSWCNPPYRAENIEQWLKKGLHECVTFDVLSAFLLPARVGAAWWRDGVMMMDGRAGPRVDSGVSAAGVIRLVYRHLEVLIYFHDERLAFDDSDGAPFDSALVIFEPRRWNRAPRPQSRKRPKRTRGGRDWPTLL